MSGATETTPTNTNTENIAISGSTSYTGADGKVYTLNFTADEDGFKPDGAVPLHN